MEVERLRIAVVPGDGIGPEVCAAAIEVLKAAVDGVADLDLATYPAGAETYRSTGDAYPPETLRGCRDADAVLHGAAGLPDVTFPDGTEAGQDFSQKTRATLDLYANIRPVRTWPTVSPAVTSALSRPVDYIIVRENTEGLYASRGGGTLLRDQVATDTIVMTREGIERVVRKAADLARRRGGAPRDGKRRVTVVDKANVLRGYAFFRKVALEVLEDYPDVETECILVDAMTTFMVREPERFDVVVTENIFGDILSDLGAATVGGLGLAPSAEIGDSHGCFQSVHGSAPDIAGKGIANPIATILSAAMMLDWFGERRRNAELSKAGERIRTAVEEVLSAGECLTPDLGGTSSTVECGEAIQRRLAPVAA
ncbi:isocitrate/isopropylmalate dehydrogenase family protein [Bauldia sp.]|uniref:isocitrate/isopropylmalate dehydrogenase family protein n=1 Tax=Bauldia sp. TaxID=2575872 RepID=UPI003BAAFA23